MMIILCLIGFLPKSGNLVYARTFFANPENLLNLLAYSKPNDTIRLQAGIYQVKKISLNIENITIIGSEKTIIEGDKLGTLIEVKAPYIEINNITIRGTGNNALQYDAAIFVQAKSFKLLNSRISDYCYAVYAFKSDSIRIQNNVFIGDQLRPSEESGNTIHLYLCKNSIVQDNQIKNGLDAIYYDVCDGGFATNNRVVNARYGIHYMNSRNLMSQQNKVDSSFVGIAVMFSENISVNSNSVRFCKRPNAFGILLQEISNCDINFNRVEENETGLMVEQVRMSTIKNNVMTNNITAIELHSNNQQVMFTKNVLAKNWSKIRIVKHPKIVKDRYSWGGVTFLRNDWMQSIIDFNHDGLGDIPIILYSPFDAKISEQPILQIFRGTLAASFWNWTASFTQKERILDLEPTKNAVKKNFHWEYLMLILVMIGWIRMMEFWIRHR